MVIIIMRAALTGTLTFQAVENRHNFLPTDIFFCGIMLSEIHLLFGASRRRQQLVSNSSGLGFLDGITTSLHVHLS